MASRRFIGESAVLSAVRSGRKTLRVPKNAVISPLARDAARKHGLTFEDDSHTAASTSAPAPQPGLLAIGSDHGGYDLKEELKPFATSLGFKCIDVGTDTRRSCDYPDFAYATARMVADGRAALGIMIDGAGIGSSIACNKVPGIRAACAGNEFMAFNARAHNNANILTLGSRSLGVEVARRIVKVFLETPFEGGRHGLRVAKLDDLDRRFR